MPACCAPPSRSSRAAATSSSCRPQSSTTRRSATTKSSAICISRTRSSRQARECYDKVIASRADSSDPFYRRALAALALDDYAAAVADLEIVVGARSRSTTTSAPAGLLAHALGKTGHPDQALALFAESLQLSTLSETQYNYAALLAEQGRTAEAREWADGSCARSRRCPATCGAGSGRGSGRRRRC